MMNKILLIIVNLVIVFPLIGKADTLTDLKTTVLLRAETIKTLKGQGVVQEGPGGLLVAGRSISPPQERLMQEENVDRQKLFDIIATKTGKSATEIALAFEQMAKSGSRTSVPSPTPIAPKESTPLPPVAPTDKQSNSPLGNARSEALPMKIITRPFGSIHEEPNITARKVQENVPAFTIYYVYRKTGDWYEVGENDRGSKLGWMNVNDVIEWKQNLVVQFTHPDKRHPVLMFKTAESLRQLVQASAQDRKTQLDSLYSAIDSGNIPSDFPVESVEPRQAIDSHDQFYLLPIVDYKSVDFSGREGRLLQLAAATRQRGTGSLNDNNTRTRLTKRTDFTSSSAKGVLVDLVFVMDLTRSMGPFAEQTLKMMQESVRSLGADAQVANAMRFGFWGYRDSPSVCKGIEFNTRNFTPELQSIEDFTRTLSTVHETTADSVDYEEDVFAGMADAINDTKWRSGAIRMIVLVGDAPGRAPGVHGVGYPDGPVGTASGMDAATIRSLADGAKVYVTALYLKASKWKTYADAGAEQFKVFSKNPNSPLGSENFRMLNAENPEVYRATAEALAQGILNFVRFSQAREPSGDLATSDKSGAADEEVTTAQAGKEAGRELARNMFRGAMVEWLGSKEAAKAPTDVTVWSADKDLFDPVVQSLDVQIFLTKNQLNDLKVVLDRVADAGIRGKISGEDFFESLRAVVAAAASDPGQISKGETLAKSSLVPAFLKDLPYQSTVMGMSNETWRQMSPDAQAQFLNTILAKLHYYQLVHDNSERWVALNDGDLPDNWVAAIPLDQLP
ncbi:MAG: DUF1318 domain-containing protein [Methylophilaceae bacterium]|nr:MAG: DUF1318 domain-containing protein [Methylophilaceae bacterium]